MNPVQAIKILKLAKTLGKTKKGLDSSAILRALIKNPALLNSAIKFSTSSQNPTNSKASMISLLGDLGGSIGGGALGAALGTAVAPGIGTAVGSVLGSAMGGAAGGAVSKAATKKLLPVSSSPLSQHNAGSASSTDPSGISSPSKSEIIGTSVALPLLGDAARTAGAGYGAYQSLLGNAMMAMNDGFTTGWSGSIGLPTGKAAAIVPMTKSIIGQSIGNQLGNRFQNVANEIKAINNQTRAKEFQSQYHAPGLFWSSLNQARSIGDGL